MPETITPDPERDLVIERVVDVPPALVWRAWTEPEHLKVWFCPKPWRVTDCEMDVRPGGIFRTTMCSPEGEEFPNVGCFLEVVPGERLVFTDALTTDYRPAGKGFMTAIVTFTPENGGTRYRAVAIHADEASRRQHEEMGFQEGWGKALDQLVEHARSLQT